MRTLPGRFIAVCVLLVCTLCGCTTRPDKHLAEREARERNPYYPVDWWQDIGRKPDSWYRSDEGRRLTASILSWQDQSGGWPLMNTTREANTGDPAQAGPWGRKVAYVKATVSEIRFLARACRATGEQRTCGAAVSGLEFILRGQYPTGGWPQSYPPDRASYSHYATYNDDVIPDLMAFLLEVPKSRDFEFLAAADRERAKAAFDRGITFILKTQIVVDGRRTAWAQQYDEVSLEPRAARPFEPVAISGGESATVLQLLMSVPSPGPELIEAIEAGVAWYRDVQIDGYRLVVTPEDRVLVPDASAPPLWARFYEIGTNRPIFAGRDGVVKYAMADVERERRAGYAWYGQQGQAVFEAHARWLRLREWDRKPPTNVDESKVRPYVLPEVLRTQDGRLVTTVDVWEGVRRPELLALFATHQHGVTPSQAIETDVELVERDVTALGGTARRTQVRIRFPRHPDGPVIRVLLNVPAKAQAPVPTLLYVTFSPNVLMVDDLGIDEGMAWSASLLARVPDRDAVKVGSFDLGYFIGRGYAVAMVYYGDIEPDFDHGGAYGVRSMFDGEASGDRWGAIGAWAWGLSRVFDYLQTDPNVDASRVAIAGASRLGKAVLWTAAQDQRFAMAIPLISGEGGASLSRRNFGETVADLTHPGRYHYWYAPNYANYAFAVERLPVDAHMLLALIAPRPVLQLVGATDDWSDPQGEWAAAQAASVVYELYGLGAVPEAARPPLDELVGTDQAFMMHAGGHEVGPIDYRAMADFMGRHFRQ